MVFLHEMVACGAAMDGRTLDAKKMQTGLVKWFSPGKGYGFVTRDDGEDLFLHYSGLAPGQERRLYPGDRVEFDEADGEKGLKAVNVRCVEKSPTRPVEAAEKSE